MGHQPDASATTTPMTSVLHGHAIDVPSLPGARHTGTPAHMSASQRRWRSAAASLTVATAIALAGAGGAAAADDPSDGGLWYYTATGMDTIHQTTQGKGITIAVLDSQVNPAAPDLVGTNITVHEPSYCAATNGGPALPAASTGPTAPHGTGMDGIIVGTGAGIDSQPGQRGIAPQATIHHYAIAYELDGVDGCRPSTELNGKSHIAAAIDQAVADGAKIISLSYHRADDDEGFDAIGRALKAGVILVASAPHEGGTTVSFPASANGVVAVESVDPTFALTPKTTTSSLLTVVAPGEYFREIDAGWASYALFAGSSNATAYTSAALALVWSAYPKATANQILQTLIRNTNGTDHVLGRDDSWGYGLVNVRQMLEHDPTQYPDTNPLLREGAKPSTAQILATATPTSAPTTDATTGAATGQPAVSTTADDARTGVSTALLVGGGIVLAVLLLLVVGGIILAVVLTRRRSAGPRVPGAPGSPGAPHQFDPPGASGR